MDAGIVLMSLVAIGVLASTYFLYQTRSVLQQLLEEVNTLKVASNKSLSHLEEAVINLGDLNGGQDSIIQAVTDLKASLEESVKF